MTIMSPAAPMENLVGLRPEQIDAQPWRPVAGCGGVRVKELGRHGDLVYELLRYDDGAMTPGDPHPAADQHIWVLSGEAEVAGHNLPSGSYAYVPAGASHPIRAVAGTGCVLQQTHVPVASRVAEEPVIHPGRLSESTIQQYAQQVAAMVHAVDRRHG
ncbi:cupin domain-containing protein [Hamadaea sp. NPDC051192]|uniref:cupin domain-containing protein n=1 Tax=Hamadaea sp. NPDC051192 TaxID=3154940 RepID=UPI00343EBB6F